jgi:hypothetical protein
MAIEFVGFICGVLVVGVAGLLFLRHEVWKTVNSVYGREVPAKSTRGNALIWPSH